MRLPAAAVPTKNMCCRPINSIYPTGSDSSRFFPESLYPDFSSACRVRGYLDGVAIADVGRFEHGALAEIKEKHADILSSIRGEGEISSETNEKLTAALDAYKRSFA